MADEPNAKPAAETKRAYAVLRALKHDGKLYLPADDGAIRIRLTEAEAAELKALGAVGDPPVKAEPAKPPAKT